MSARAIACRPARDGRRGRSVLRVALNGAAALVLLAACSEPELILPGERIDLRADPASGAPVSLPDRPAPIALPAQVANADWTHKAGNPRHDPPHAALSALPRPLFEVAIGQGEDRRHRISADPIVAGGRVFTVDSHARVMAHTTGGAPLWARDLTPPGDAGDASGGGLAVAGGRLFVGTGFGDLAALDPATGTVIWRQDLGAAASGAPTVQGDLVYVAARDALSWAIRADTGRVAWTLGGTPSPAGVVGGAAPAVDGRIAVFPYPSGEVVAALKDGGTRLWGAVVAGGRRGAAYAGITDISGDPVIVGDTVFVGNASGRIVALDAYDGANRWTATEGAMSPVLVAGGAVFAVTDRAELVRLDAGSGARVWGTRLPYFVEPRSRRRKAVTANYGPVLAGGRLWVAASDAVLRGFDPVSGAQTAAVPMPAGAATNPVVANGILYVVTERGTLAAFR